jgi:hypothetical protein
LPLQLENQSAALSSGDEKSSVTPTNAPEMNCLRLRWWQRFTASEAESLFSEALQLNAKSIT